MNLDRSMAQRRRPPPSPLEVAAVRKARAQLKAALTQLDEIVPEGDLIGLDTVDQVVRILGGTAATSRLVSATMQQASDWKRRGFFPENTFDIMREALKIKGYTAPNALWRMKERAPDEPEATRQSSAKDE